KNIQREVKLILNDMSFAKVLTKKNKLDNVNDLWYFVRNSKNRWVAGSAH
ncbi:TPA: epipeptide YydF family RiPP, partial [Streptococcus agalactiae]|nr:epipeptide YydF family RiPP [Streptococcus agalactiae]HEN4319198.1 epipeptide YydF family RiPP [Streptococcus agalactiae]HEN4688155.1 epipeptide YydF family RiPP [Streptococcus agalactiae]HEN4712703.1 epipeptide YydF family RiPP [Streptococcus agalactiae]